ncbi:MAG: Hint domain-containing protein [Pseudomonadota bacterium]
MAYTEILNRVNDAMDDKAPVTARRTRPLPDETQTQPHKWTLGGFGPMTRVSTSFGDVHAQALRERDMIRTQNGNLKPIRWVDRVMLDQAFVKRVSDATAIMIRAGALGQGLPKHDVVVSPQQEIGIGNHGAGVKYQRAYTLLGRPGVMHKPEEIMTYTMFHCGEPVCVKMEGIWARVTP